ncbi:hypothetical protein BRAS3843_470021 [Bradyrhizobium sp. STM 3843]|nr:hypothetical protein BRAS3843_470021 [Bradyrhizobium sp. STM 3843]
MVLAADAAAADLPLHDVGGFPIALHQIAVLGPTNTEPNISAVTVADPPAWPGRGSYASTEASSAARPLAPR